MFYFSSIERKISSSYCEQRDTVINGRRTTLREIKTKRFSDIIKQKSIHDMQDREATLETIENQIFNCLW